MSKQTAVRRQQTSTAARSAKGVLQRQCACGTHTVAGGECAECGKQKNLLQRQAHNPGVPDARLSLPHGLALQSKLTIGASNDPLEQEADRIADQVLAAPVQAAVRDAPPHIQRYTGQATAQAGTAPASVGRVLSSSGRPLEPALRQDMEQRFGHDFSRVRVHSGGAAEQSARDVNANAYTVGHNIVFGAGRFAPGTHEGQRLIAHELTHVVQQSGADGFHVGQSKAKSDLSSVPNSFGQVIMRQPAGTPGQTDAEKKRGALKHAFGVAGGITTPAEFYQLKCVINEGGTSKRPGGLPDELDIKNYNEACRKRTGYSGPDVTPTPDQWEELRPGALDVISPGRLKQLQSLLMEHAAVIAAGGLSDTEIEQIDAAIKQAEQRLGALRPPDEAQKPAAPNTPPWVIKAPAGKSLPGPGALAVGATATFAFSSAARAAQVGGTAGASRLAISPQALVVAAIAAGLVCIGYLINDYQLRKEGAAAIETLIGMLISIYRSLSDPEIERRLREEEKEKEKEKPKPKPDKPPPTTVDPPPGERKPKDACLELLGLRPGINDRRHVQRVPIAGHTTVSLAQFRLDRGINPPAGQDTTPASRDWVRTIGHPKDDAGHVIGNRFGGRADFNAANGNIFPQDLSFNRGTMRSFDAVVAGLHQSGCDVCVRIVLEYESDTALRPSNAWYTYLYRSVGATQFNPPIGPARVPNP